MANLRNRLIAARTLIADVEHWTQGANAINALELEVDPASDDACAWCADGALIRVCGGWQDRTEWKEASNALSTAAVRLFNLEMDTCDAHVMVNDGEVAGLNVREEIHEAVLNVYDAAIRSCTVLP